ncbi:MAG: T9SS type A sorting domain-containing protein [Bacteroidia bacterium]|nr:T9SS type A sorting domain-containing protein [Bacteroidia bacterium]
MPRLLLIFILISTSLAAQYTDRYWAFGDSAAIDFKNLSNPQTANSVLRVRGSCASICDSSGDLLFYCGSPKWQQWLLPTGPGPKFGYAINKNHQTMFSGDSIVGLLWYQEMVIVPMPDYDSLFYIFSAGVSNAKHGLFYSVIDVKYNNGQGKVIQKNVQLRNDSICDGITAVRHGNGRDWWVVVRSWKTYPVNDITVYLISPSGITAYPTQHIGTLTSLDSFYRMKFNLDGNHLYNVSARGIIERLDFDRCTGIFSNQQTYSGLGSPYFWVWGFEVSPDESKLYISLILQTANQDTGYVLQFDLNSPNFLASVDTLGTYSSYDIPGLLELGPDRKIYVSIDWSSPDTCFDYLYCYGTVSTTNSNLSVINYPDSLGSACDYQPFSFYLGGHKAYFGLPNNHNYELGAWVGSPCDTLTVGINELFPKNGTLKIYYDKDWQSIFVNAKELKGRSGSLQIFNSSGQLIYGTKANIDGGYYSSSSLFSYPSIGVYIVRLQTDKEVLTSKFVKW